MKDLSYLKDRPIAVLGGGAIAKTIAADCRLAGNTVRICDIKPYSERSLYRVRENGIRIGGEQLSLYGYRRSGTAHPDLVTECVEEAVRGAGIVIIGVPSVGHETFFRELIPHLEDGMMIHIIPDNYGCLILRRMMREAGCTKQVVIGGWASPPFDARVEIQGGVALPNIKLGYRAFTVKGSALPAADQEVFLESTKYIGAFDSVTQGDGPQAADTVLDTCLSHANPFLHTVGLILGVGVLENFEPILGQKLEDFSIYSHAFCPSISNVQYAFYEETKKIAEAMGVKVNSYRKEQFYSRESVVGLKYMGPDYAIPFNERNHVGWGTGPTSVHSRYLTEDVPVGCHILHLLGRKFGVSTPVIDSMITLASAILETEFYAEGVTLENLGIAHMSKDEILEYVRNGVFKEER